MVKSNARQLLLSSFSVSNLGPVINFSTEKMGMINLFIGENSCGKTYMMKLLYVACKAMETYKKGKNIDSLKDIIYKSIYWTYQSSKISNIIHRKRHKPINSLKFECKLMNGQSLEISIDPEGNMEVTKREIPYDRASQGKVGHSVFLPAKEVLTNHPVIVSSREDDGVFGFDDTYYDLARVIQRPTTKGRNSDNLAGARTTIYNIFNAKANYNSKEKAWTIVQDGETYDVSEASEGIRKLSILDILLGNRYIRPGSIIYIDEPESALHPKAVSDFMDAIYGMSRDNIQFIMASHSYFVIKKLENIAKKNDVYIPIFSYQSDEITHEKKWICEDMREGMPNNPIILESIKLYRDDLGRLFD